VACPICNRPAIEAYRPFCSKRCADIDLGRWLNGDYVLSGDDSEDEDGVDAPGGVRRQDEEPH
jgi:endogenous inhibitor of DNA gyrase (YacG/DUF329 family)